ncbi:MAG: M23 family metallopeptidase [Pseudomonadota bacterium]
MPERSSRVRRIQVPRRLVTVFGMALLLGLSGLGAAGAHYYYVIDQVAQNRVLLRENSELRDHLTRANQSLDQIGQSLTRVDLFERKLREITRLNDPARGLAIGPVNEPMAIGGTFDVDTGTFAVPPVNEDPARQQLEYALLESRLSGLAVETRRQEVTLGELSRYFDDQQNLLSNTPSVWPVRGWLTSEFGMRDDPYTGARTMHLGLDISTADGKPVMAPATGTVAFAGDRGGYGNVVVIDHGRGISTFYAHLKEILVKPGDTVKRGDHIAAVGNTGRSTGPHLHYEVRLNDLPINPVTYILE